MNNNLETTIATINLCRKAGQRSFCIVGPVTASDIAILRKETGIELVKDCTPFFRFHLPEQEAKEYVDFLKIAYESSLNDVKTRYCLNPDGTIGVETIEMPSFIMVVEPGPRPSLSLRRRIGDPKVVLFNRCVSVHMR